MSKIVLAVDAGHGVSNRAPGVNDPGVTAKGFYESRIALAWGLTIKEVLTKEFGIKVVLTRHSDTESTPLTSRPSRARAQRATHFLSLHCNGATPTVRGTETLYRSVRTDFSFANKVHKAAVKAMRSRDRGVKVQTSVLRGSPPMPQSLYVLNNFTTGPACLLEIGFLPNYSDRIKMLSKSTRSAFARALGQALTK